MRKARAWQARTELFLDEARGFLLRHGYHGLTFDRIPKATGYSRGTIYLHFKSKEDIVLALVCRGMERRYDMIRRAAKFRGGTRERMQAVGEAVDLFVRLYPDDVRLFHLGNAEAILQRASNDSLRAFRECLRRTVAIATGIVEEAIAEGDLALNGNVTPEMITFNLWAITELGHSGAASWTPPAELGITNPLDVVNNGCEMLCDGYGWKPLSRDWDYAETRHRVRKELFPQESKKLEAMGESPAQCAAEGAS